MYMQITPDELEEVAWAMLRAGEYSADDYQKFCLTNRCMPSDQVLRERFTGETGDEINEYFELCDMFGILAF